MGDAPKSRSEGTYSRHEPRDITRDTESNIAPGTIPLWLRMILGVVIVGLLGLLVLLGLVLHDVFVSHNQNVIILDTAKGQLLVGAVTGILTIAIASGTIWYARLTHILVAQAEATRSTMEDEIRLADEQLLLNRMSLRLAMRPRLADVPADWGRIPETISHLHLEGYGAPFALKDPRRIILPPATAVFAYLIVPLRNIGTGPAVVTGGRLMAGASTYDNYVSSEIVVPTNEMTLFTFAVSRTFPSADPIINALTNRAQIDVSVSYTNAQGDDAQQTQLSLGKDPSDPQKMRVLSVTFTNNLSVEIGTATSPTESGACE